jgi:hypothetical protein
MYSGGTNNPYGTTGRAYSGGAQAFSFTYNTFVSAVGNYNLFGIKTGEINHTIKAGFETTYFILNKHYNNSPSATAPVIDIYTDM